MAAKYLVLLVIASVLSQGLPHTLPESRQLEQITLADSFSTFTTNSLIAKTFGIPKSFLDTLESCHVVYPNGITYEAYPNNQLPEGPVSFLHAVQPFTSCSIAFLGADVSMSGTYELMSLVYHPAGNYRSLTRQRLHLTLVEADIWQK